MDSPRVFRWSLLGILAGAAVIYVAGNARVALWDRDEPRYAECSREMLQSGDWVVPRFLGEWRTHKPPLIYWFQAASMELFGRTGAAARLPSALAAVATAALLAVFVRRFADPRTAVWSALVFVTSAVVIVAAKLCITDSLLLPWIAVGQGCLFVIRRNSRSSVFAALLFWLTTGLAGLTKGPVVLAVHGGTLLTLALLDSQGRWRQWRQSIAWWKNLHPLLGIVVLAAVVGPWLALVQHRAPDFLPRLLSRAQRYAAGGAEGHWAPPGYYLLLIWGLFFPWSILLPAAMVAGWKDRRADPLARFALAAAVGPWVVMELVGNKLPFYILPSFPALAILTARVIARRRYFRAATIGAGAMALGAIVVCNIVLPSLAPLAASRTIGQKLHDLGAGDRVTVSMIDYREPSLAFYQGGGAREGGASDLASAAPPAWAVITTDAWEKVAQQTRDRYNVVSDKVPVWIYNDGWRSTALLIIHARSG